MHKSMNIITKGEGVHKSIPLCNKVHEGGARAPYAPPGSTTAVLLLSIFLIDLGQYTHYNWSVTAMKLPPKTLHMSVLVSNNNIACRALRNPSHK